MDTSKEYIEMCRNATEIQECHKYQRGDFYLEVFQGGKSKKIYWLFEGDYLPVEEVEFVEYIWLPRQDQLQEMIPVSDTMDDNKDSQLFSFYEFCFSGFFAEEYHRRNRMSYEQLWLAFVMKEKYNKIWDGENWVKEK